MTKRKILKALYAVSVFCMVGTLPTAAAAARAAAAAPPGLLAGFVDDLGQPVTDQTLKKPYRLVVFGYTSCPDVCPLTLLAVHMALEHLAREAEKVDPVFVTVDPDRDTVDQLHRYVSAFDARIRGYRAGDEDLDRLTKLLHVRYWRESLSEGSTEYWMSHTATIFLLTGDEQVVARIDHVDNARDLSKAIEQAVHMAVMERY
jgi:protein SCO1/2